MILECSALKDYAMLENIKIRRKSMWLARLLFLNIVVFLLIGCKAELQEKEAVRIAFLADVHLQNVYGEFTDSDYDGVKNPLNGEYATIRTMASQLNSTRLFNENYFAFLAALDDIAAKGVKLVALPGDFSDDGQALNVHGLGKILHEYTEKHAMQFFITTGNHDPVRPFFRDGGKKDYLGTEGKRQPIFSAKNKYEPTPFDHPVVIASNVAELGYSGITNILHDYGFFPRPEFIYWETPFSTYTYDEYNFSLAEKEATLKTRYYNIPPLSFPVPDVSYLIEPVPGVWLLAIDANVYVPVANPDSNSNNPKNYKGASIGYNNVLTHKKHLISWVEKVSAKAKELDKKLIAFSHYPMVDFHNDASPNIQQLLGKGKLQTHRVPDDEVAHIFADAGIKLHFAGHLHVNDTGVRKSPEGNALVNIQIPSLAAYIPAYKLLTIDSNEKYTIETVVIDSVPRFNEFFALYEQEYNFLKNNMPDKLWNAGVLSSKNYMEFTEWHLKELVRMRFMPGDWALPFGNWFKELTGKELLILSQIDETSFKDYDYSDLSLLDKNDWKSAENKVNRFVRESNLSLEEFEKWKGEHLLLDFYKLRSADELAFKDIGEKRLQEYVLLTKLLLENNDRKKHNQFDYDLHEFALILDKFINGTPSIKFSIDMNEMILTDLNKKSGEL